MDRRMLLSLFPTLVLPLPAWAAEHRGVVVVNAIDMLVPLKYSTKLHEPVQREVQDNITVGIVQDDAHDLSCKDVSIFDSRTGNRPESQPWPKTQLQKGQVAELFREVVRVTCLEARDSLGVPSRPDFKADRSYMFWDNETARTICCTSHGPIGYRFQEGDRYGAVALARRITSVWEVVGGPRYTLSRT